MRLSFSIAMVAVSTCAAMSWAGEDVFSGPQVGEDLPPFEAQWVFGENAGKKIDVVSDAEDSPLLLVFVHEVTRPSVGLTRMLMNYAATRKADGLKAKLVFLSGDPTETAAWMQRARHALPAGVTPLISVDGVEGPGAYGLDRKMTLTVLVANHGKVTANFPLVQPSIQADGPKIGHAMVKVLGGDQMPTLLEMGFANRPEMQASRDATYRRMMAPVIGKTTTPEEVDQAAKAVEDMAAQEPWFRDRVHTASNLIINGGKLDSYGTAKAQEYLQKWSTEFAPKSDTRSYERE